MQMHANPDRIIASIKSDGALLEALAAPVPGVQGECRDLALSLRDGGPEIRHLLPSERRAGLV